MKKTLFLVAVLLLQFCSSEKSSVTPVKLRCNNLENPAGTGSDPVFSWIASASERGAGQTAYQIIISSKEIELRSEEKACWNSGKQNIPSLPGIPYTGPDLQPATRYYWKVRVWDNNDMPSSWSKPAHFITGLFEQKDWSGAEWIGYEEIPDSMLLVPGIHGSGNHLGDLAVKRTVVPYFRTELLLDQKVDQAFLFISGIGQYELHVNGEKIGDRFLSPGWTDYDKTCYYNSWDVTENLRKGENAIGVIVGNGFYNINRERYRKLVIAYGAPKLIAKLKVQFADGSVRSYVSDISWLTAPSPVKYTSIYGGEDYDAGLEQDGWDKPGFDDSGWRKAVKVRVPSGALRPEGDHPLKVMQEFDPVRISAVNDTSYVYDFGQNASGIIRLNVSGDKGKQIRLVPSELIGSDSLVTQRASGGPYYFSYTTSGREEETWMPRFTYYGFRYVQVHGAVPAGSPNPSDLPVISGLKMLHTRNSSPAVGTFKCSSGHFNSVYNLIDWAIRSNLASVATDCPHREKLGWLEQTHLMGNSIKYVYDIHNLYNKIVDDMIEAQLDNGLVPDIAPEYVEFQGGFRDSPEWSSACIILPWDLYEWYGDIDAVKRAWPMMEKYMGYLTLLAPESILIHGLGDWYDLGPKFPGEAQLTPKSVTATSIYYYDAKLMADMASLLGNSGDEIYYRDLANQIKTAFNQRFLNTETKVYSTGSQTAYAMPLFFGMVDDIYRSAVVKNLVDSIKMNNNALTAGDVGYRYLLRALEQEDQSQLIFDMNSKKDVPGYGFQLSKGATALTESWAGLTEVSNNHMMLGHLMEWFYSGIGGIRQAPGNVAYKNLIISPEPVGDLEWAETSYESVNGTVSTRWELNGNEYLLNVKIPVGSSALVMIPQKDQTKIWESGKNISETFCCAASDGSRTMIKVTPGEYSFRALLDR